MKRMYATIKKNAYIWADGSELREWLKKNEGKRIAVETKYLFNNQYNTKRYRLFDSMIEKIENDARVNMGKCKYCGTMLKRGQECTKHEDCKKYGIEWFTPENTYFLKYPEGLAVPKEERLSISPDAIKIGTYYLENYPSLGYFRLYNGGKTINFKYANGEFWIADGIGFDKKIYLDVPAWVLPKIKEQCEEMLSKK